jgi:nitroreductase
MLEGGTMDVIEAVKERRAFRSLDSVEITDELIKDLASSAQLAPSCFNNQPTRFVFVYAPDALEKMHDALSRGNEWVHSASLIIAVFSKRATELGLVAHPIAGFSPKKTKEILGIPEEYKVITLVNVGKHSETISPVLSEKQVEWEKKRPERFPLEKILYLNKYEGKST